MKLRIINKSNAIYNTSIGNACSLLELKFMGTKELQMKVLTTSNNDDFRLINIIMLN